MVHITTAREVLAAISNAPRSIGHHEIQSKTGIGMIEISHAIGTLCLSGHIKEDSTDSGTFLTRRPMRDEIASFCTETCTLTGVHLDNAGRPEFWCADFPARYAVIILAYLRLQPEAAELNFSSGWAMPPAAFDYVRDYMLSKRIIKEHSSKPGKFFTNPEYREQITHFLDLGDPSYLPDTASHTSYAALAGEILRTLLAAPHADKLVVLRAEPLFEDTIEQLLEARLIRYNDNGYFTRRVMREAIRTYVAGQYNDANYTRLLGTTEPVAEPVTTPPANQQYEEVISILRAMRNAPHAIPVSEMPDIPGVVLILAVLKQKGVVKVNDDGWFTRRQHRAAVDQLLEDRDYPAFCLKVDMTNSEAEDGDVAVEEYITAVPACTQCIEDDNENLRELVRDMASVISRLAEYV